MLLLIFFSSLLASLVCCVLLIHTQHLHGGLSMDLGSGVQKFHVRPTPRVGGVPVMMGLLLALSIAQFSSDHVGNLLGTLLLSSLPVFLAGLLEDITKKVSPLWRLLAAFSSAGVAVGLIDGVLPNVGIPGVDALMTYFPMIAVLLTVFAVGGVCHAVNIIDGYNGLMGGVTLLIVLALAYVSLVVGDLPLLTVCLALSGAVLGFLVWNFPKGLIFAGDAGAYLIGFILAEISVLLVARHPDTVSPWFPFLLLVYPVFETLFTIWRRKKRKMAAGLPDSMHFHQMIYKRLVRWMVGSNDAKHLTRRNSLTAPYLWGVTLLSVMPALLFWKIQWLLQLSVLLFIVSYVVAYRKLVNFRVPKIFVLKKENPKTAMLTRRRKKV